MINFCTYVYYYFLLSAKHLSLGQKENKTSSSNRRYQRLMKNIILKCAHNIVRIAIMIEIFGKTTTYLTAEYISTVPAGLLHGAIDDLKPLINIIALSDGEISLQGQWQNIVKAHSQLEHCLKQSKTKRLPESIPFNKDSIDVPVVIKTEPDSIALKVEPDSDGSRNSSRSDDNPHNHASDGNDSENTEDMDLPLKVVKKTRFRRYKCSECIYSGQNDKWLQRHILRVHQKKIKCQDCGKKFGLRRDLRRHKIEVHSSKDKYFCAICNKYLKTKRYIDNHMQLHQEHYVYQCKICEKSCSTKILFSKHLKIKHPKSSVDLNKLGLYNEDNNSDKDVYTEASTPSLSEQNNLNQVNGNLTAFERIMSAEDNDNKTVYESDILKVTLKSGKNRGRPRIKNEMDAITEFPCHLCEYIGRKESHLEYHVKRNHSQKLKCNICNKQFGYNWDLKRHMEQVHSEASFFCHICSKSYKVKKSFEEHLRSHEDGYVKSRYLCPHCDKTFSAKQVLDNHLKYQHMGVKQKERQRFLCQTCGQEFFHKYSYQSHMNKHAGLVPFSCEICGKRFASEHSVREHQLVHKNVRNFTCNYCTKSFKTNSALKAHEAIHVGAKDFKCLICGKGFVQKQSLMRHERIHSGYKPYKCLLCQRKFTDGATIRKHMILVHKKDPHDWQGDVVSYLKRQFIDVENEHCPESESNEHSGGENSSSLKADQVYPTSTDADRSCGTNGMLHTAVSSGMHINNQFNSVTDQTGNYSYGLPSGLRQNPSLPVNPNNSCYPGNMLSAAYSNPTASVANASVEMAAASILNLSAHLAPLHSPLGHMVSVQSMETNMPTILNLSSMQNISYNQTNDQ